MNDSKFKQGDIVQVTNIHHPWFPALLVVHHHRGHNICKCGDPNQ